MEPCNRYRDGDEFGLYGMRSEGPRRSWEREDIAPKTVVICIDHGGDAVAVPVASLEAEGPVQSRLGDTDIIVVGTGSGATLFVHPEFEVTRDGDRLRGDGTTWDVVSSVGADGRQLDRLPARRLFAFAWQDDTRPRRLRNGVGGSRVDSGGTGRRITGR